MSARHLYTYTVQIRSPHYFFIKPPSPPALQALPLHPSQVSGTLSQPLLVNLQEYPLALSLLLLHSIAAFIDIPGPLQAFSRPLQQSQSHYHRSHGFYNHSQPTLKLLNKHSDASAIALRDAERDLHKHFYEL